MPIEDFLALSSIAEILFVSLWELKVESMNYIELVISVNGEEHAEIVTAMLSDMPFEAFASEEQTLRAYITDEAYATCREDIAATLQSLAVEYDENSIAQQNWNAEWESGFSPVRVDGRRPIYIRAEHHPVPDDDMLDVVIAPRMSFGTGHHITTALMSRSIAELDFSGKRGLDMGCGTGVLAIVAVKCGATGMVAVDIDEWACDSARESIALSGVDDCVEVRCGSMAVVGDDEKFDFVLANINRNILVGMMPAFAAALDVGGRLLMSGFLEEDVPVIESAAAEQGFVVERVSEREGWMVVECKKQ